MVAFALVVVVAGECRHPDGGGVAGAVLLDLFDERDVRPPAGELLHLLGHLFGAMTHHQRCGRGAEQFERMDDVQHHRAPQIRCSGLGRLDRIRVPHRPTRTIAETFMYSGRGIGPLFSAPKTAVLPLDEPGRSRSPR